MGFFDKLFGKASEEKPKPNDAGSGRYTIEEIKAVLAPFKRTAYFPIVEETGNTFSAKSKMGGYPYLRNVSDWPVCPRCKKNMQLFLQLDMAEIPDRKNSGLIQFFYCTNSELECDIEQEGWAPFSENSVCRKITVNGESATIEPTMEEVFPEKVITGWEAKDDYPSLEEYEELGIGLDVTSDNVVWDMLEKFELMPLAGDKLFGWPYWVQNVEYPSDRKTGTRMDLIFQIDSDFNLPFMFGDSGAGHLTQSPDDENELAFGWACC